MCVCVCSLFCITCSVSHLCPSWHRVRCLAWVHMLACALSPLTYLQNIYYIRERRRWGKITDGEKERQMYRHWEGCLFLTCNFEHAVKWFSEHAEVAVALKTVWNFKNASLYHRDVHYTRVFYPYIKTCPPKTAFLFFLQQRRPCRYLKKLVLTWERSG